MSNSTAPAARPVLLSSARVESIAHDGAVHSLTADTYEWPAGVPLYGGRRYVRATFRRNHVITGGGEGPAEGAWAQGFLARVA